MESVQVELPPGFLESHTHFMQSYSAVALFSKIAPYGTTGIPPYPLMQYPWPKKKKKFKN
jgi:hypothetical protein